MDDDNDDFLDFIEEDELDYLEEQSLRNKRRALSEWSRRVFGSNDHSSANRYSCSAEGSTPSERVSQGQKAGSSKRRKSSHGKKTSKKKEQVVQREVVPESHFWRNFFIIVFELICMGIFFGLMFFS